MWDPMLTLKGTEESLERLKQSSHIEILARAGLIYRDDFEQLGRNEKESYIKQGRGQYLAISYLLG